MSLSLVLAMMETGINRFIQSHPDNQAALKTLAGKSVEIIIQGLNIKYYLVFAEKHLFCQSTLGGHPDIILSAPPFTLLKLFTEKDLNTSLFSEGLTLKGDIVTAQQIKLFLESLQVDWAYYLSQMTGDVVAGEAKRFVDNNLGRVKRLIHRVTRHVSEYLQEEVNWFPSKQRMNDFLSRVDRMKNDVARLEQRVERVIQQNKDQ